MLRIVKLLGFELVQSNPGADTGAYVIELLAPIAKLPVMTDRQLCTASVHQYRRVRRPSSAGRKTRSTAIRFRALDWLNSIAAAVER